MVGYTPGLLCGLQRGCFRFSIVKQPGSVPPSQRPPQRPSNEIYSVAGTAGSAGSEQFLRPLSASRCTEDPARQFRALSSPARHGWCYEHKSPFEHKRREFLRPLPLPLKDGPPQRRLLLSRNIADSKEKLAKGLRRYRLITISDPPLYDQYTHMQL